MLIEELLFLYLLTWIRGYSNGVALFQLTRYSTFKFQHSFSSWNYQCIEVNGFNGLENDWQLSLLPHKYYKRLNRLNFYLYIVLAYLLPRSYDIQPSCNACPSILVEAQSKCFSPYFSVLTLAWVTCLCRLSLFLLHSNGVVLGREKVLSCYCKINLLSCLTFKIKNWKTGLNGSKGKNGRKLFCQRRHFSCSLGSPVTARTNYRSTPILKWWDMPFPGKEAFVRRPPPPPTSASPSTSFSSFKN